jgi:hypothetical protein
LNVNGSDDASFKRLDKLGAATGDNFARCNGNDVSSSKKGPRERGAKSATIVMPTIYESVMPVSPDLECRRQKREFVVATTIWL